MSLPAPYYSEDGITIYHGDCRDMPWVIEDADLIVTDPPYPDWHQEYAQADIGFLKQFPVQQFVFWSARAVFPLDYTAIHIWDKRIGVGCQYERIFERGGGTSYRVFRCSLINSPVTATFARDDFTGHPSQKPVRVLRELIRLGRPGWIVDPFMGSGSTLIAARQEGRKAIGIEIEERYCEIAVKRLAQGVLPLEAKP